jgi:hypothetical protein
MNHTKLLKTYLENVLRIGVVHTGFRSSLNRRVLKWLNGSNLVRVWSLTGGGPVCGRATKCEN